MKFIEIKNPTSFVALCDLFKEVRASVSCLDGYIGMYLFDPSFTVSCLLDGCMDGWMDGWMDR